MVADPLVFLGIGLGVFASMSGTIGKQLLRASELFKRRGNKYLFKVSFALGLALNTAVGPIVDMLSYMFAPQSLIAPLGGLDVVWNTLMAPCTLGEKLTLPVISGAALIAGGATVTSLFGNHDDKEYGLESMKTTFARSPVLIYLISLAFWLAFNVLVLQPRSAGPRGEPWVSGSRIRGLSLGLTAGSLSGNMFCVKGFVELVQSSVRDADGELWLDWMPYALLVGAVVFALSNVYFLTKGMREYEALFMGAVFEGSLIVSASVSGCIVYQDLEAIETYRTVIYFVALSCIIMGIMTVAFCYQHSCTEGDGDTDFDCPPTDTVVGKATSIDDAELDVPEKIRVHVSPVATSIDDADAEDPKNVA